MSGHTAAEREALARQIAHNVIREVVTIYRDPESYEDFKNRFVKSLINQERFFVDRVIHPEKALGSAFAHLGYAMETLVKEPHKVLGI